MCSDVRSFSTQDILGHDGWCPTKDLNNWLCGRRSVRKVASLKLVVWSDHLQSFLVSVIYIEGRGNLVIEYMPEGPKGEWDIEREEEGKTENVGEEGR